MSAKTGFSQRISCGERETDCVAPPPSAAGCGVPGIVGIRNPLARVPAYNRLSISLVGYTNAKSGLKIDCGFYVNSFR